MPTLVMCRNRECGELFEVPDSAAGASVRCPSCGGVQHFQHHSDLRLAKRPGEAKRKADPSASSGQPRSKPMAKHPIKARLNESAGPAEPAAGQGEEDERIDLRAVLRDAQPGQENDDSKPSEDAPDDLPDWAGGAHQPPAEANRSTTNPLPRSQPPATARQEHPTSPPAAPAGQSRPDPAESDLDLAGFRDFDEDESDFAPVQREEAGPNVLAVGVFGSGLAGLLAGAVLGAWLGGESRLAWVYLGALAGWAGGFVLAFLAYLGVCPEQIGRVPCPTCGCRMDRDEPQCHACGRTLHWADVYPMTVGCCRALQVAASHWPRLLGLAAVGLLPAAWWALRVVLPRALPDGSEDYRLVLTAGMVLTSAVAMTVWLRVLLQVGNPFPFRWEGRANFLTACKALALVALFSAPVLTLALLPIRLLELLGLKVPGGLGERFRRLASCANDYALLWLWLMLYAAIGLLTVALYVALARQIPLPLDPAQTLSAVGRIAVMTLASFVPLTLAALFATAMFCCIAAFGRQNAARLTQPLPEENTPNSQGG